MLQPEKILLKNKKPQHKENTCSRLVFVRSRENVYPLGHIENLSDPFRIVFNF
jgi:hypothetical protein